MIAPESILLNWLLAFPFIGSAVIAAYPRIVRLLPARERASAQAAPAAAASAVLALSLGVCALLAGPVRRGSAYADYLWTPHFFQFRLRLDALGLYALLAVLGALFLSALWAAGRGLRDHVRWAAFVAAAGACVGVIVAADLVLLYLFWELLALAAWAALTPPSATGRRFLTWGHAGGVCALVAMLWAGALARDTHIYSVGSGLLIHRLSTIRWVGLALIVGVAVRLALVPLHGWLCDLVKSAPGPFDLGLIGAGVAVAAYVAARLMFFLLPNYAAAAASWLPAALGLFTTAYAGARALLADNIRDGVAHLLIAVAGQVALGIGLGMRPFADGLAGALALLPALALGAALLAAGIAPLYQRRNWSEANGIYRTAPAAGAAMTAAAWTLCGLPPLAGFWGHHAVAAAAWRAGSVALLLGALVAPGLILAYGVKAAVTGFGRRGAAAPQRTPPWQNWWVGGVVAASLVLGAVPGLWLPHLEKIARTLTGG